MFPHGSRPACGRPHGAAPTVNLETVPLFRRGRTLAGPQIYAARPGGRALQPCTSRHLLGKARRESGTAPAANFADLGPSGPEEGLRAATWGRPYGVCSTSTVGSAKPGAKAEPHQPQILQTQGPVARWELRKATQILRAGRALPTQRGSHRNGGQGKACGRVRAPAPTAYPGPGTFARQSQARKRNRTSGNFCKLRAQWPDGNCGKPLKFCAPGGHRPPRGGATVMGGRGRLAGG